MSCDISLGRLEPCKDVVGGLRAVYFVNYGGLDGVTEDADDQITELFDAATTTDVYKYDLKGNSSFDQTIVSSRDNGTTVFTQTLTLVLKKQDATTHKEVKLLAYGRPNIIIEDNNGNAFVAGLNWGCDVTGGTISSGAAKEDFEGYNITFEAKELKPANFIDGAVLDDPFAGLTNQPNSIVSGT